MAASVTIMCLPIADQYMYMRPKYEVTSAPPQEIRGYMRRKAEILADISFDGSFNYSLGYSGDNKYYKDHADNRCDVIMLPQMLPLKDGAYFQAVQMIHQAKIEWMTGYSKDESFKDTDVILSLSCTQDVFVCCVGFEKRS